MVNSKKDEKDKRTNLVHIAFSDNELEVIENYRKESNKTKSQFVRDAINEKIRMIEHPELFTKTMNIDNEQLRKILEQTNTNTEKIDLLIEKMNVIGNIQNTLSALSSLVNRPALKEKEDIVIALLKEHGELIPQKIMKLLDLSKEDVYDIITNEEVFSINIKTGAIKLNE